MRTSLTSLLALTLLVASATPAAAVRRADPLDAALAGLATAAQCGDASSPWRPWCIAATGWSAGTAADLPTGKVLVGLTVELAAGQDVAKALSDRVSLTAFAIGKDGKVKITTVKPTNDDENQAVGEAVFALAALFKGKADVAKLPKDLAGYVGGLQGAYAATKGPFEWTWQGAVAGRARKVGATWVVIETTSQGDGFFVTILTDAWAAK